MYGETCANAIGPQLVKNYGKNRKAAFMTPDYTYGHTVTKSVNEYLTQNAGWTQVTDQVSPLGTQDFSQYLTNIANSGAEFIINVNWPRHAVLFDPAGRAVWPHPGTDDPGHSLSDTLPRQGSWR